MGAFSFYRLLSASPKTPHHEISSPGPQRRQPVGRGQTIAPARQSERKEPLPGRPAKLANLCAMRTGKSRRTDRKMNKFIFPAGLLLFFCPGARLAAFQLQAQIVWFTLRAPSPTGFFAAFFPGKKARILPPSNSGLYILFSAYNIPLTK